MGQGTQCMRCYRTLRWDDASDTERVPLQDSMSKSASAATPSPQKMVLPPSWGTAPEYESDLDGAGLGFGTMQKCAVDRCGGEKTASNASTEAAGPEMVQEHGGIAASDEDRGDDGIVCEYDHDCAEQGTLGSTAAVSSSAVTTVSTPVGSAVGNEASRATVSRAGPTSQEIGYRRSAFTEIADPANVEDSDADEVKLACCDQNAADVQSHKVQSSDQGFSGLPHHNLVKLEAHCSDSDSVEEGLEDDIISFNTHITSVGQPSAVAY